MIRSLPSDSLILNMATKLWKIEFFFFLKEMGRGIDILVQNRPADTAQMYLGIM